ncbi:MAG: resolvase [Cyanobium sp.]|jgi:RNase H-fold protein (predicted Holliday junction resolvase)
MRDGSVADLAGPLAGLDPGRSKCGLVRTDRAAQVILEASVLPPDTCFERLLEWRQKGLIHAVVIGDGTGSGAWHSRLAGHMPVLTIGEKGSTLEARQRFWNLEPAQGWRRLLPEGLRQPPRDWDDVVAQLLLERWLGHPLRRRPSP